MRLKLTLHSKQYSLLPFNYQYPLSSAIYKIIQSADAEFAAFLHNTGYGEGHKSFKLFNFSDIKTPFVKNDDRMQLQTGEAELIVCFFIPQAAENFIKGLFINQQLRIADHKSKTTFVISHVESLALTYNSKNQKQLLQPLSPMVVGKKNSHGHYDYRSPEDKNFRDCLLHNWIEKYSETSNADVDALQDLKQKIKIDLRFFPHPPQQRLITIKGGTDAETKIRGYTKFRMEVTAPEEMLELAMGAGLGLHNAQGMGCVGVV